MNHATLEKAVLVAPPAVVDNDSVTVSEVDTAGFRYCRLLVAIGSTDVAMTALKVQESDTTGSGFADVSGLDFASALPGALADSSLYGFDIDLRGRKRFLQVVATAGDGSVGTAVCIIALLSRAAIGPDSASERGLAAVLSV